MGAGEEGVQQVKDIIKALQVKLLDLPPLPEQQYHDVP